MLRAAFFAGFVSVVAFASATHVRAVAATMTVTQTTVTTTSPVTSNTTYGYTYTYDKTEPTVTDWDTGWNASGVTGWDYVGSDNGASAVYLGNGYVLSAGHVGAGNLILDGQTYDLIANSAQSFGSADLTLYKIDETSTTGHVLTLPKLTLETSAPTVGSSVVMIGYGNGQGETWGANTIYATGQDTKLTNPTYDSTDFYTADTFRLTGTNTSSNSTSTTTVNTYLTTDGQLVPGDSGGGDFIYDASTGTWELAGINEVLLQNDSGVTVGSGMVQISTYAADIDAAVPEPPTWVLGLLSFGLLGLTHAVRRIRA